MFRVEQETLGNLATGRVVLEEGPNDIPRMWILRDFRTYRNPFVRKGSTESYAGDLYEYTFEEYGTANEMQIVAPLYWTCTVLVQERN